jgi:hypothetical protein
MSDYCSFIPHVLLTMTIIIDYEWLIYINPPLMFGRKVMKRIHFYSLHLPCEILSMRICLLLPPTLDQLISTPLIPHKHFNRNSYPSKHQHGLHCWNNLVFTRDDGNLRQKIETA